MRGSEELLRQLALSDGELRDGLAAAVGRRVHPEDEPRVRAALEAGLETGAPIDCEVRLRLPGGGERIHRTIAEAERERRIAGALQRSLLPQRSFDPEHLEVAT